MPWNQVQPSPEALAALDPYLEWGTETNFAYYFASGGGQDFFPVILELQGITAEHFAIGKWNPPSGWQSWLRIPPLYAQPPAGLERARFCTANVTPRFFHQLRDKASPVAKAVKRVGLSVPTPSQAPGRYEPLKPRQGPAKPRMVVTGIIDDGLAFANERFRRGLQTRVEYIWNQDGPAGGVPGVLYGRETLKHDVAGVPVIDTLMANARHGGPLVAEEEVYRASRHIDYNRTGHKPVAQRGAHGTHVMDVACGFDAQAAPADRPIIGVQLPVATTWNSSGALLAAPALDGLRYIVDRADQLAAKENCGPLPIVVNLSYGFIAGPHDGDSFSKPIDEVIGCGAALRCRSCSRPGTATSPAATRAFPWRGMPGWSGRCVGGFSLTTRRPASWNSGSLPSPASARAWRCVSIRPRATPAHGSRKAKSMSGVSERCVVQSDLLQQGRRRTQQEHGVHRRGSDRNAQPDGRTGPGRTMGNRGQECRPAGHIRRLDSARRRAVWVSDPGGKALRIRYATGMRGC
jgi:hypothetical protein